MGMIMKKWVVLVLLLGSIPAWASQIRHIFHQTESDIRSLARALESYAMDNQNYPPFIPAPGSGLNLLTTPVAYRSSIPNDPFAGLRSVTPRPLPYTRIYFSWFIIVGILFLWVYGAWSCLYKKQVFLFLLYGFLTLLLILSIAAKNDLLLWRLQSLLPWNLGTVEFYPDYAAIQIDDSQAPCYYFYMRTADGAAIVASQGPDPDYNYTPSEVSNWTLDDVKSRWPAFAPSNGLYSRGDYLAILPPP